MVNPATTIFRQIVLLLLVSLLLMFTAACGGSSKSEAPRPAAQPVAKTAAPAANGGAGKPMTELRKLIETAQLTLETKDLPATEKQVMDRLNNRKGIVSSSNITLDGNGRRNGNYTLRVPAGQLQPFLQELAELPNVIVRQRSLAVQDVTEEYIDINARLENMQRQEKRLREILATATRVEDILKVEKELAAVRTQIESLTGRLKALTGKIELSTVQLRISEVVVMTETNFWGKLKGILRDSWVAAGDVVLYIIATVIVLSPLALLVALLWWVWQRRQKAKQTGRINIPPPEPPK
jgi:hypothetical protein